jgi:hypothetical protein
LVSGFVYEFSQRLRIVSGSSFKYYIKLYGYKKESGNAVARNMFYCPTQSAADGWKTCSAQIMLDDELESWVDVRWELITQDEDENDRAVIDYDDISIAFKSGVSITADLMRGFSPFNIVLTLNTCAHTLNVHTCP